VVNKKAVEGLCSQPLPPSGGLVFPLEGGDRRVYGSALLSVTHYLGFLRGNFRGLLSVISRFDHHGSGGTLRGDLRHATLRTVNHAVLSECAESVLDHHIDGLGRHIVTRALEVADDIADIHATAVVADHGQDGITERVLALRRATATATCCRSSGSRSPLLLHRGATNLSCLLLGRATALDRSGATGLATGLSTRLATGLATGLAFRSLFLVAEHRVDLAELARQFPAPLVDGRDERLVRQSELADGFDREIGHGGSSSSSHCVESPG